MIDILQGERPALVECTSLRAEARRQASYKTAKSVTKVHSTPTLLLNLCISATDHLHIATSGTAEKEKQLFGGGHLEANITLGATSLRIYFTSEACDMCGTCKVICTHLDAFSLDGSQTS